MCCSVKEELQNLQCFLNRCKEEKEKLLRILQTIPSDVKQTSVHDSAEQDMKMKGNENGTLDHDSRNYGREADDPLAFESKEVYRLNGSDGCWNAKFVDDHSADIQKGNDLVEKDTSLFTDKIVCYKEINYHVVKDICVDEGMMPVNKISVDSRKDGDDSHCDAVGPVDKELLLSDELATSLENTKDVSVNEHGTKEEIDGTLLVQNVPLESSFDKDFSLEDSAQTNETKCGTANASKPESFVDKTLPVQEFGTRSFLRSFLNSLDAEESSIKQLSDQNSYGKAAPSIEDAGRDEPSSLSYNSKVETENIMFNFNSPDPLACCITNENIKEPSADSRDVINQVHPESSSENTRDQSLDHKDENSVDLSSNGPLQSVNSRGIKHDEHDNDSFGSLRRYDDGETSFSGTGLVSYSGAVSYSGNLSLCSDGSAASGRSFAFPVLQSEWNSSPVRMTKAERRHFRKHKGWRSGLLCCRF